MHHGGKDEAVGTAARMVVKSTVVLRYELLDAGADTCLERTMSYNFPNPLLRLADRLFLQRKTERETREALSNLRQILEARLAHQD